MFDKRKAALESSSRSRFVYSLRAPEQSGALFASAKGVETMFVFKQPRPVNKKKKGKAAQDALDQLNAYLNAAEAEPVYWLCRLWGDQQKAMTYQALRESILSGQVDEKMLADWQAAYANFVKERLQPIWTESMAAGAERFAEKHPGLIFDPFAEGVQKWTQAHGAQWVTNVTDEARDAMAAMIDRATTGAWTADELSRAMRPLIGLTKPQATANLKYYEHVKASLLEHHPAMKPQAAEQKARESAMKYAARQQRQRAYTIATTELAYSYNKGADEGVRQAVEQGLMGKIRRVWSTAADEAVCPDCGALEGVSVDMDEMFQYHGHALDVPPAHPRCHCAVAYEETEN